jgi:uncharacterized protein
MLVLDINVLVGVHHAEAPEHSALHKWMLNIIASREPYGFPDFVLFNFIRVVTLPRPWHRPSTTAEALDFCAAIVSSSGFVPLEPSSEHWACFDSISRSIGARGNMINDAYLAAYAMLGTSELVTLDQDFGKFPGLRWRHPLDTHVRTNPR